MKIIEYGKENRDVVMLLHGGGLSWWNYRSEAELLGRDFHVVLPVLDGHADSGADFAGIGKNADALLAVIDSRFGGSVLVLGGLSLGAQIAAEMLSKRADVCRYAVLESASVIPSPVTEALIGPAFGASYGLVRKKWFAKMQFKYLRLREDLFDDYYRDTAKISRKNMTAFLKASTAYEAKPVLRECRATVRIVVGGKEQRKMRRSAQQLRALLPDSCLEIGEGLYHGEYSVRYPKRYVSDLLEMIGRR